MSDPKKILRTPPSLKYVSGAPGLTASGNDNHQPWIPLTMEMKNNKKLTFLLDTYFLRQPDEHLFTSL